MKNYNDKWAVNVPKLMFSKDDHGKYANFLLSLESIELILSLSHNKLIIKHDIVKVLLIAL